MISKNKKLFLPALFSIISLLLYIFLNLPGARKNIPYNDFLENVSSGKVSKVTINSSDTITFYNKSNEVFYTSNPRSENFIEFLLLNNIIVKESTEKPLSETIPLSMILASLALWIIIFFKDKKLSPKGIFAKGDMQFDATEQCKTTFSDVAGNLEAKENLRDIIDFIKNPDKYQKYGARMPKGVLFYGSPGTGKTLLAKAVAGEAGVPFFAVSGSDFVQMYVGVGASRIRKLFAKARSTGKAVIFIDEIDAIGKQRNSSTSGSSEEKDQTLNALLTEMSGFNGSEGIIVIAATNRFDMLDNALLRPGRFDRHVEVSLPDINARKKIIDLYMDNKPMAKVDLNSWAKKTAMFSGAKIENFLNEAAIIACKSNDPLISSEHLEEAYTTIIAGSPKQDTSAITQRDRIITAYHEIGHALISMILLPSEEISRVSIIPSTKGAGGYTLSIPEDRMYYTKNYICKKIIVLLGGRAAEDLLLGDDDITTGAHNDFQKATGLTVDMVSKYGMGKSLGLLNYDELKKKGINVDSEMLKECKDIQNHLYSEALSLLKSNMSTLKEMSELLLDKEILTQEDLYKILYKNAATTLKNEGLAE